MYVSDLDLNNRPWDSTNRSSAWMLDIFDNLIVHTYLTQTQTKKRAFMSLSNTHTGEGDIYEVTTDKHWRETTLQFALWSASSASDRRDSDDLSLSVSWHLEHTVRSGGPPGSHCSSCCCHKAHITFKWIQGAFQNYRSAYFGKRSALRVRS